MRRPSVDVSCATLTRNWKLVHLLLQRWGTLTTIFGSCRSSLFSSLEPVRHRRTDRQWCGLLGRLHNKTNSEAVAKLVLRLKPQQLQDYYEPWCWRVWPGSGRIDEIWSEAGIPSPPWWPGHCCCCCGTLTVGVGAPRRSVWTFPVPPEQTAAYRVSPRPRIWICPPGPETFDTAHTHRHLRSPCSPEPMTRRFMA